MVAIYRECESNAKEKPPSIFGTRMPLRLTYSETGEGEKSQGSSPHIRERKVKIVFHRTELTGALRRHFSIFPMRFQRTPLSSLSQEK